MLKKKHKKVGGFAKGIKNKRTGKTNFNGNTSMNARINIDYTKEKPSVKFSYPNSKKQFKGSMLPYLICVSYMLCIIIFQIAELYPINAEVEVGWGNTNKFLICVVNNSENTEMMNNYTLMYNTCYPQGKLTKEDEALLRRVFFLGPIIFSLLIYYPFKKKWMKFYPKFNSFISSKGKYIVFTGEDVRFDEFKKTYYCEVPQFKNVLIDYETSKDFSRLLTNFEIKEHKFKSVYASSLKKAERKKKKVNEWDWYARFYFSDKPINGELKVLYK
jgi:hypothetical protein